MIRRLRRKLVWITVALLMVMLTVILCMIYFSTASDLREHCANALEAASHNQFRPGRPGNYLLPVFTLEETDDGALIASGSSFFDLTDGDLLREIYEAAESSGRKQGILREYSLRYQRSDTPAGVRYAFADISAERSTLQHLLYTFLLISAVSFAGFFLIASLLARWAVKPVETAWQQQQQFVADASHELKTPLTVILTNAELLQSPDCSPEDGSRLTANILAMSRQMRGLVEGLLRLARVDSGQAKTNRIRVDLSRLAEEAALCFEPVYFEAGLTLEWETEPDIPVMGDPQYLRQIFDILLDNGRKYSAPGSTCRLTLSRQGKNKALAGFFSPGTPLTPRQCQDIFKRFYRADTARAMSGSYGLGLSIAQRIVQEHGGRIWAESAEGGNLFCVQLPM